MKYMTFRGGIKGDGASKSKKVIISISIDIDHVYVLP